MATTTESGAAVPAQNAASPEFAAKSRRDKALEEYRKRLIDHKELDDKLKKSERAEKRGRAEVSIFCAFLVREDLKEFSKEFDKSEEDLKSLQSGVGQIVGEVLRQLTEDKCEWAWPAVVSGRGLRSGGRGLVLVRFFVLFCFVWFSFSGFFVCFCSHCEGFKWSSLCGWLQKTGRKMTFVLYPLYSFFNPLIAGQV